MTDPEKRYLKSDMDFLGATLADIRRVARHAARDPGLDRDGAVRLVEELWSCPTFERRVAAALILELHADDLRSPDLSLIERLIRESRTWALVDDAFTRSYWRPVCSRRTSLTCGSPATMRWTIQTALTTRSSFALDQPREGNAAMMFRLSSDTRMIRPTRSRTYRGSSDHAFGSFRMPLSLSVRIS
jgi:hypothetical protein